MEEVKTFQLKATLHQPILLQLHLGQICLNSTTPDTVATQAFDDDQTSSTSWINMRKTSYVVGYHKISKNNLSIMRKKQSDHFFVKLRQKTKTSL